MRMRFTAALAIAVIGAALWADAQTTGPTKPPLVIPSLAGSDLFAVYCSSCHGRDGAGHGTGAAALRTPPPDLRLIARRNHGEFPRKRIQDSVANGGHLVRAHGTSDMPVWGPVFKGLDPSDTLTRIRIEHLVQYLESMQVSK